MKDKKQFRKKELPIDESQFDDEFLNKIQDDFDSVKTKVVVQLTGHAIKRWHQRVSQGEKHDKDYIFDIVSKDVERHFSQYEWGLSGDAGFEIKGSHGEFGTDYKLVVKTEQPLKDGKHFNRVVIKTIKTPNYEEY